MRVTDSRFWILPAGAAHALALVLAVPVRASASGVLGRYGNLTVGALALLDLFLVAVALAAFAASYSAQEWMPLGRGMWARQPTDGERVVAGVLIRWLLLAVLYWSAWTFASVVAAAFAARGGAGM